VIDKLKFSASEGSCLITEGIPKALSIREWLTKQKTGTAYFTQKRSLLRALGEEVGKFHYQNFSHGDMNTGNIFCETDQDAFTFIWLDNERTIKHKKLPLALRIKNLTQLNMLRQELTRTDRMRFWKAYQAAHPYSMGNKNNIIIKVIKKTQMRWRKRNWL